jgi:hypothetical protein
MKQPNYIMIRPRSVLITVTTGLIAGLVFRLWGKAPAQPNIVQDQITEPYQAPFSNPNAYLEDPSIIPDAYIIHLAPGHSIEDHSSAIRTEITPYIHRLEETNKKGIIYTGKSIPYSLLSTIRADPRVSLVDYMLSPPTEGTPKPSYQAPLQGCDAPRDQIEPQSFQILLAPDYSFKDHFAVIGQDITPLIQNKYNFHTNKWVYSVKPVGRELLRAIRSDRGVELVVCESKVKRQTEGDLRPKGEL